MGNVGGQSRLAMTKCVGAIVQRPRKTDWRASAEVKTRTSQQPRPSNHDDGVENDPRKEAIEWLTEPEGKTSSAKGEFEMGWGVGGWVGGLVGCMGWWGAWAGACPPAGRYAE